MRNIQRDIATWLWRLLPGNPIFLRVLQGGGRRVRHLYIRLAYLLLLFLVMSIALLVQDSGGGALDDLAKGSTQVFRFVSITQLAMICFLAPVFMAAAITQEKDSQTYNILLSTPLSNAQIVLGSLMSRLFFVLVLVLAGVPIFCATTLYGGITLQQIMLSTGIAATTAVFTGSLAIALSVTRVGTRRTIFSFYLAIAMYLMVVGIVGYPRSFQRDLGAISYFTRGKAIDEWVKAGNEKPPIHPLVTAKADVLDTAVNGIVPEGPARRDLIRRLREADGQAAERRENAMTFFGCRGAPLSLENLRMSWLAPFHPLLSLQVVLNVVEAPSAAPGYPWPMDRLLVRPHYGYMVVTLIASLLIVTASMIYVRRGNREGETTLLTRLAAFFRTRKGTNGELTRKPRRVWHNPVAWREARTRASFAGRGAMQYVIVIVGLACAGVLLVSHVADWEWFDPSELRLWLTGLIAVEFAMVLLMAANSAATSITRERESNTMDLLLSTPLTSGYIIRGKARGLVSFLIPLILVPVVSLLAFALADLARGKEVQVVWIEAPVMLGLLLVVYASFASMLGLQMSLQFRRTVPAVLSTVGILMATSFALGACGYGLVEIDEEFGAIISSFTPFTAVAAIVNPIETLDLGNASSSEVMGIRFLMPLGAGIAAGFYAIVVTAMYRAMIRNFDMTVRKQSA